MSDLSKWTVAELKSELKVKGLSPSGRKAELISRLREFNKSKPDTDDTIVKIADNKEPVAKQTLHFSEVDEQESHETLEGESGGVPDAKQGQTHELGHSPTREDVSFVTMDEVLSSDEAENNTVCEEKEENKAIEKREIVSSERVQQDDQKTQDAMIIEDVAVKDGSNSGENSEEKTDSQAIEGDSVHTDNMPSGENKTTSDRDQDNAQHLGDNNMCESSETEEGVLYIDMDTDANENTDAKEGSVTIDDKNNEADSKAKDSVLYLGTDSDAVHTSETGQDSSVVTDDQKNAKEIKTEEGESVIILDDSGDETEAIKAQSQDNGDQNAELTQSETFQPTQLPMPTGHFKNWLGKQLHLLGRERTLFVNPVSCKDQMCELLRDWGPKCADFQLHFSKEGTGAALLGFKTLESLNVAKTAISQLVGNDKVLQMTDLFYLGDQQHSLILADSVAKDFFQLNKTKVITRKDGSPKKTIELLKTNPCIVLGYKLILLHLGTNWLGTPEEFELYQKLINSSITKETYESQLKSLNPPPALGSALDFKRTFQELVDLIKSINEEATILISSIIPRKWDHDRRHQVRVSYNQILQGFNSQPRVFFIRSYRPFFTKGERVLRVDLFDQDGLHLSNKGAVVLRTYFCDKIDKGLRGVLK